MSLRRDGDVDEKDSNEGPDRYRQGMIAISLRMTIVGRTIGS